MKKVRNNRFGVMAVSLLLLAVACVTFSSAPVLAKRDPAVANQKLATKYQKKDQGLRKALATMMLKAAKTSGVSIEPGNFVYLSRNDLLVVNAPIVGIDALTVADLASGANLLFIYASVPQDSSDVLAPPGLYTVKVFAQSAKGGPCAFPPNPAAPACASFKAQLIDAGSHIVGQTSRVTFAEQKTKPKVKFTGGVDEAGAWIDVVINNKNNQVIIRIDICVATVAS
jgi:hypothetical protein